MAILVPQPQVRFAPVLAEPNGDLEVAVPAAAVHERQVLVRQHDAQVLAHEAVDEDPLEHVDAPLLAGADAGGHEAWPVVERVEEGGDVAAPQLPSGDAGVRDALGALVRGEGPRA